MLIEVLQENLNIGLSLVSRVISGKIQMPILGNVLLTTENGQLKLTGTNLEITLTNLIGAKIITDGSFTVPARTFSEIIAALPPGKVSLEQKEGQLVVKSGKFVAKINGIPASDWPMTTKVEGQDKKIEFKLEFKKFKDLIAKTVIAVGTDEARAALTGVLVKGNGKELTFVATDGFRLSLNSHDQKTEEFSLIIPSKALLEISRMEGKTFNVEVLGNDAVFTLEDVTLTARLIAGNFPAYEKIIPKNLENDLIFDAQELLKAVKFAGVFARDSANIIKLAILNNQLSIRAQAQQTGENENAIEVKTTKPQTEEFVIAFNYHYLLDLLNAVSDCDLKFSYSSPLSAGLFQIPGDPTFLHLIMPVRVQS